MSFYGYPGVPSPPYSGFFTPTPAPTQTAMSDPYAYQRLLQQAQYGAMVTASAGPTVQINAVIEKPKTELDRYEPDEYKWLKKRVEEILWRQ